MLTFFNECKILGFFPRANFKIFGLYFLGALFGGISQIEYNRMTHKYRVSSNGASDSVLAILTYTSFFLKNYLFISAFTIFTLYCLKTNSVKNLAHASHLGGILTGLFCFILFRKF